MPDAGIAAAKRCVQRRVVDVIAVPLVESERYVHVGSAALAVHPRQVVEEPLRLDGEVAHPAFEEIPGEGAFRRHDEPGRRGQPPRLAEHLAQPGEVFGVAALAGPELGQGDGQHR